jgi:hypothetical protein
VIYIGNTVVHDRKKYHVQDIDYIHLLAYIGTPDSNNIIWDAKWISFDKIVPLK